MKKCVCACGWVGRPGLHSRPHTVPPAGSPPKDSVNVPALPSSIQAMPTTVCTAPAARACIDAVVVVACACISVVAATASACNCRCRRFSPPVPAIAVVVAAAIALTACAQATTSWTSSGCPAATGSRASAGPTQSASRRPRPTSTSRPPRPATALGECVCVAAHSAVCALCVGRASQRRCLQCCCICTRVLRGTLAVCTALLWPPPRPRHVAAASSLS